MSAETKIGLLSGGTVDLLHPRPSDIRLYDIAHNLANICRFSGACEPRYSVARHSLLVASLCSPRNKILGLMHDAAEAYLGDVSTPLKSVLPYYRELEARMHDTIMESLGLPLKVSEEVHDADRIAFLAEWERFMPKGLDHGLVSHVDRDMLAEARQYLDEVLRHGNDDYAFSGERSSTILDKVFVTAFHEYNDLRKWVIGVQDCRVVNASRAAPVLAETSDRKPQDQYQSLQLESD